MTKTELLDEPDIQYARDWFASAGRAADFNPALDRALAQVQAMPTRPNRYAFVQLVLDFLQAELAKKPATTKAGRIIRAVLRFVPQLLGLIKKKP